MNTHRSHMSRAARLLASVSLIVALNGCDRPARKPANAKACAALAARLCQGSNDSSAACKATLDLLTPEACAVGLSNVEVSLSKLAAKRKQCDELFGKLCADLGSSSQGCAMVRESPSDFTPQQCESMLREYPQVLAELRRQEEQNKPLPAEAQSKLLAGPSPSFGPEGAKVNIVEFSDFQCPYCSRAADTAHAIRKQYGDKVHFVFRQYPLSMHENAQVSAEASLAAHAQGKFWELHDKMFAHQGELGRAALEQYAQEVGIDMTQFKKALDTEQFKAVVDSELSLGEEVGVDGTPTMFLNGQRIADPTNVEHVSKLIDSALSKTSGS